MSANAKAKKAEKPKAPKDPPALPPGCEALLSKAQICFAIGVSSRTLDSMIAAGEFPRSDARVGAFPRWRVQTLNAWIGRECEKPKE